MTKVRMSCLLSESEFSPEFEIGLCEECWAVLRENLPWLFRSGE
jgi:hypothetical protein